MLIVLVMTNGGTHAVTFLSIHDCVVLPSTVKQSVALLVNDTMVDPLVSIVHLIVTKTSCHGRTVYVRFLLNG